MNSKQLARTWPYPRYNKFESILRDAAKKWFKEKGFKTHSKMAYCLRSFNNWANNIICPEVTEYIFEEKKKNHGKEAFPLHKYLHHGLSSQAMIFNLIGPLIVRDDISALRQTIEQSGIIWPKGKVTAEFEYDDRMIFNEDSGQPTSIDLVISGEINKIFIEAKLVEREFGGCSVFERGDCDGRNPIIYGLDDCYLHHIGRKYWELMKEFGFNRTAIASGHICPFINYYQFFREVLFSLKKRGSFILLHDERNPAFLKLSNNGKESGLWPFLARAVPSKYSGNIKRITIQQLVEVIAESRRHDDWIDEFRLKYGIKGNTN